MQSDEPGVPDVMVAASFAGTSGSAEALEPTVLGGREVDASDVNVCSGFAEAPTSPPRIGLMRTLDGGCGMGGRCRTDTKMLKAPTTHHHMRRRSTA